jgi:SAM-dependent methyltransferase
LRYFRCETCDLTFLDPAQRPSLAEERAEYALHRNEPDDPRYRAFLQQALDPLLPRLKAGAKGLDFGCGPGPTLSVMLTGAGYPTADYDPIFRPDAVMLTRTWDFVTCTEVVEHLHQPGEVFAHLDAMLKPGGVLSIMTERLTPERDFAAWRYRRQPSHVAFYSDKTMAWIGGRFGWRSSLHGPLVVLFEKRP